MKETETHIFFWGGIFSNFYPIDGPSITSEKTFMMQKALTFRDKDTFFAIANSKSPMAAKRLGRQVKGFDGDVWDKVKVDAMMMAIQLKALLLPEFVKALRNSNSKILVEASPDDRICGIGFDEDNAIGNEEHWGQNLLGKCLMDLRDSLT